MLGGGGKGCTTSADGAIVVYVDIVEVLDVFGEDLKLGFDDS